MAAVILSALFGVFEAFILKNLLFCATSGNTKKMAVFLLIKFVTYGIAIAVLLIFFSDMLIKSVIGYSIGLPLSTVIWFTYSTIHKKNVNTGDGKDEHDNNN